MNDYRLTNIHNKGRLIYLFLRDENDKLEIREDKSFFPYYYEPAHMGDAIGFDGTKLKKMFVGKPSDVPKQRTSKTYEADIIFTKRYLIDRVNRILPTKLKVGFLDIEVLSDEFPKPEQAKYPVSCITIYNNYTKEYKTFFLGEYETEFKMIEDFVKYLRQEKFDIITGWNLASFDYVYLYNRFPDFAEKISPIEQTRYGQEDIYYPAGTSIVDYLTLYKKLTLNRENQYSLDYIAQTKLNKPPKKKIKFEELNEELREHNINDVKYMVELEEKTKLIDYYDTIRRLTKTEWEDQLWNSRALDMLLLSEAKKQNVVLPMKPSEDRGTLTEKEDFKGAFREIFESGRFENVAKLDLSAAYPSMIVNFCLDPINITNEKENSININEVNFKQNPNALLPAVTKRLMILKKKIKDKLLTLDPSSEAYKDLEVKHKGIKSLVNSAFGVFGNRFFRLYSLDVASSITYLVRDLLKYTIEKLKEKGYETIYVDTDGIMIKNCKEDISELANGIIKQWTKEKYNKDNIDLEFEFEGYYENILLLALCRYVGNLNTPAGMKKDICGVEARRKDSTVFIKEFQNKLFDKILKGEDKNTIINWIKEQIKNIKNRSLIDIGHPAKLAQKIEDYKNTPIFARAMRDTKDFEVKLGQVFYYTFIKAEEYSYKEWEQMFIGDIKCTSSKLIPYWEKRYNEKVLVKDMDEIKKEELITELKEQGIIITKKVKVKDKPIDVIAFTEETEYTINRSKLDWTKILERNVYNKVQVIFEAMKWDMDEIKEKQTIINPPKVKVSKPKPTSVDILHENGLEPAWFVEGFKNQKDYDAYCKKLTEQSYPKINKDKND